NQYSLTNVQQFGGALSDDVDTQQVARVAMEDQFQTSGSIAADLAACNLPVKCHAHFVWHVFVCQLLFGLADKRDFGNCVNAERKVRRSGIDWFVERPGYGNAPLLHRDRSEAGKSDDISDRVNIGLGCPVVFIHSDTPATVRFETR